MIDPDRRNAIYQSHLAGVPQAQISRQFHVSPRTVRAIIRQRGAVPQTVRKDKIHIDPELLRRLYRQCGGWVQRMHEILVEDEKVRVSYPTLTRRVRELELGKPAKARCDHVPDEPGWRCSTTPRFTRWNWRAGRRGSLPACCTCGTRSGGT